MQHLCDGLTYEKIGKKVGLNERTVRTELDDIIDILGVANREEAIAFAVNQGVVTYEKSADLTEFGQLPLLVVEGKSNKEIADILETSVGSVKQMLYRMYRKLGVSNRAEFTALYSASH